jgi:leucyl-tRNA synthetase
VSAGTAQEELTGLALANDKVKTFIQGKQVLKTVVVPDRLVNIVIK